MTCCLAPRDSHSEYTWQIRLREPLKPDDPATPANRRAREVLRAWDRPFLTAFGDRDPVFRGADRVLQREVPGAAGQPHTVLPGAGHFVQEDRGPELARIVADFIARTA